MAVVVVGRVAGLSSVDHPLASTALPEFLMTCVVIKADFLELLITKISTAISSEVNLYLPRQQQERKDSLATAEESIGL